MLKGKTPVSDSQPDLKITSSIFCRLQSDASFKPEMFQEQFMSSCNINKQHQHNRIMGEYLNEVLSTVFTLVLHNFHFVGKLNKKYSIVISFSH